jgi:uncharacterized protein (DUF2235 family)
MLKEFQGPFLKRHDDRNGGGSPGQSWTGRHIIIGLDGTWQAAYRDQFKSNVHRLNVSLNYHDDAPQQNPQIFIYSAGVGTSNMSSRIIAGATGEGLSGIILQAYTNLASNYVPGDKIYIFGFSRGAFAARVLSGLINHAGLLMAHNLDALEDAWMDFTDKDNAKTNYFDRKASVAHIDVPIEFLGVWDTVIGSLRETRLVKRYRFQNRKPVKIVKTAVQILSIDDCRWDYKPILFEPREGQTLEQIWMPGVHTDIGGGYGHSFLSTLSLLVMIDKIKQYCPDLAFDENYIRSTLFDIIDKEHVVVNNERIGFWAWRRSWIRTVSVTQDHSAHPFVELIREKDIRYKGKSRRYAPGFSVLDGKVLSPASFALTSWHEREIKKRLEEKVTYLNNP